MDFLVQNWFYVVFLVLFVALHLFGGCGHSHEKHGRHRPAADGHDSGEAHGRKGA